MTTALLIWSVVLAFLGLNAALVAWFILRFWIGPWAALLAFNAVLIATVYHILQIAGLT